MKKALSFIAMLGCLGLAANVALANDDYKAECSSLPNYAVLKKALDLSGANKTNINGGFGLSMWGTIVNRDGFVCAVAFSGGDRGAQWPGSRVISAAKAYTANAYSLPTLALSTSNLYASGQPGGGLWGLQFSNPVDAVAAHDGEPSDYGTVDDFMVNHKIGGQIVFGGGFPLYNKSGEIVGGVGVSGDTSCKDHNFGWRVRKRLKMDYVPGGVNGDPERPDNIIYDMGAASAGNIASGGFGHVDCGVGESTKNLPGIRP